MLEKASFTLYSIIFISSLLLALCSVLLWCPSRRTTCAAVSSLAHQFRQFWSGRFAVVATGLVFCFWSSTGVQESVIDSYQWSHIVFLLCNYRSYLGASLISVFIPLYRFLSIDRHWSLIKISLLMQHWMQQISASETGPNDLHVVGQFQSVSRWFRRFAPLSSSGELLPFFVTLLDTDFCLILRSGLFSIGDCQRVLAIMLPSLVCTVLVTTFVWHDYFSKCDLACLLHENFFFHRAARLCAVGERRIFSSNADFSIYAGTTKRRRVACETGRLR